MKHYAIDDDCLLLGKGDLTITPEAAKDLLAATEFLHVTTSQVYNAYKILEQFSASSDISEFFSSTLGRDTTGSITFKHEGIYREAHQWNHTYDEPERVVNEVDGVIEYYLVYSDQLRPILQLDADGNVVSEFIYATHVNVPDYMLKGGHTYRIVINLLDSVRLVVDVTTDAVAQRIDYDPWGVVLTDTNPGFQPFGFGGGVFVEITGLIRFGGRDYYSFLGRFVLTVPQQLNDHESNRFLFALADPIYNYDIFGMETWSECLGECMNLMNPWQAGLAISSICVGSFLKSLSFQAAAQITGAIGQGWEIGTFIGCSLSCVAQNIEPTSLPHPSIFSTTYPHGIPAFY